jgi:hypothetical protein
MGLLRENLAALATRDAALAERLCWPAGDDHVRAGPDGALRYTVGLSTVPLAVSPEAAARSRADSLAGAPGALLFGLGLGELATMLLEEPRLTRVVAWDRDPWLIRLALERNDWRRDLASGRLRLLLGADLVEEGRHLGHLPVVAHPLLGQAYATERAFLDPASAGRPVALVCAGGLFVGDLFSSLLMSCF